MIRIEYPPHTIQWKEEKGQRFLFDSIRKKWLVLTPEEWVRQHFLQYLVQVQQYPSSFIAVEKTVKLGELNKRFDLLVYDRLHQPWLMVECKAMEVPLTESVLHQILRYNLAIPVPFLVITNGKDCVGYHRSNGRLSLLTELPEYL